MAATAQSFARILAAKLLQALLAAFLLLSLLYFISTALTSPKSAMPS